MIISIQLPNTTYGELRRVEHCLSVDCLRDEAVERDGILSLKTTLDLESLTVRQLTVLAGIVKSATIQVHELGKVSVVGF